MITPLDAANNTIERSPFYQNLYGQKRFSKFEDIPFLTKKQLIADQLQHKPFGSNLCVPRKSLARIHRTSGTTNRPLILALTQNDLDTVTSIGAKGFKIAGLQQDEIVFNCMNYSMWMGGYTDHASLERAGAAVVPYSVGNTEALIDLLLEFDSPSIHSTPSYLSIIKKKLKSKYNLNPADLGLKCGYFGGEPGMQNRAFREKIEEEWQMKAINANYGMSDVISILGSETPERDGLAYLPGPHLYLEILCPDGSTVPPAQGVIGEAVFTSLTKEAQPLIRYKCGDIFHITSAVSNSNGYDFKFNVVGRADDMLVIKGVNFFPESIRSIVAKHSCLSGNYQIIVPPEEPISKLKIVIEKSAHETIAGLDSTLQEEIRKELFINPVIEITENLSGNQNKLRTVVRSTF